MNKNWKRDFFVAMVNIFVVIIIVMLTVGLLMIFGLPKEEVPLVAAIATLAVFLAWAGF